jgi:hypothetical protein
LLLQTSLKENPIAAQVAAVALRLVDRIGLVPHDCLIESWLLLNSPQKDA